MTWAQVEYVLRSPQESALGESDFQHDSILDDIFKQRRKTI